MKIYLNINVLQKFFICFKVFFNFFLNLNEPIIFSFHNKSFSLDSHSLFSKFLMSFQESEKKTKQLSKKRVYIFFKQTWRRHGNNSPKLGERNVTLSVKCVWHPLMMITFLSFQKKIRYIQILYTQTDIKKCIRNVV